MEAFMTVVGFASESADAAIADARARAQRYLDEGWRVDTYDMILVSSNERNPYSTVEVRGYTARLDLRKDVTKQLDLPPEPF